MNKSIVKSSFTKGNYFLVISFILLFLLVFPSCSSKQKPMQSADKATALIVYEKQRSRGDRLPLYSIEVLDNQMIRYTGKANVPTIGERLIELNKADYDKILDQFKAADFTKFDTTYKGKLRDLPLTTITYQGHTITYQEVACPKALQGLVGLVEGFGEE